MKLSIIIPMFNSEKYIEKCINSIQNQKIKNLEIIIVNDGSNDKSFEICYKIAKNFKNIKLINKNNEGQGIARNIGIQNATGKYIMFLDSDDYLEKKSLIGLIEFLDNNQFDLYIGNWKLEYKNKKVINERKGEKSVYINNNNANEIYENIIWPKEKNDWGSTSCGKIYSREIIEKNKIRFKSEREYLSEDLLFNIEYIQCIKKIYISSRVIFNYVQHENSFSKHYDKNFLKKTVKMLDYFNSNDIFNKIDKNKFYCRILSYIKSCLQNEIFAETQLGKKEILKNIKLICNNRTVILTANEPLRYAGSKNKIISFLIKYKLYKLIFILEKINIKKNYKLK